MDKTYPTVPLNKGYSQSDTKKFFFLIELTGQKHGSYIIFIPITLNFFAGLYHFLQFQNIVKYRKEKQKDIHTSEVCLENFGYGHQKTADITVYTIFEALIFAQTFCMFLLNLNYISQYHRNSQNALYKPKTYPIAYDMNLNAFLLFIIVFVSFFF
jgi:hypothetical protein